MWNIICSHNQTFWIQRTLKSFYFDQPIVIILWCNNLYCSWKTVNRQINFTIIPGKSSIRSSTLIWTNKTSSQQSCRISRNWYQITWSPLYLICHICWQRNYFFIINIIIIIIITASVVLTNKLTSPCLSRSSTDNLDTKHIFYKYDKLSSIV